MPHSTSFALALLLGCLWTPCLQAADAPDGTGFEHPVLGVDGPASVRIRFCGLPVKIQLADLQLKAGEPTEKQAESYLKEALPPGTKVSLLLEAGRAGDGTCLPAAHLFKGPSHLNLELVKRGLAMTDGGSRKYAEAMQRAQVEAMNKKNGLWSRTPPAVVAKSEPRAPLATPAGASPQPSPAASTARTPPPAAEGPEIAAPGYASTVVADLQGKEYHLPGSRYAKSIRPGARIEYPTPEAAERAGKVPSPFSFPDRARELTAKTAAAGGTPSREVLIQRAQAAYQEALAAMQEARRLHTSDPRHANANWQKAAKLLAEGIDRITPLADANPNDLAIQKLTEEMSMNLYSCNKYQTL